MTVTAGQIRTEPGDHAVHFYRDDSELVGTVGAYLVDALDQHAGAVVITSDAHIRALERELECANIDTEAELGSGRLVLLDAAATLARLTVRGQISRAAFQRTIGPVLREAAESGRRVCVYGELVDLLWQAGQIASAIELERLWNELIGELGFSLLCAYHGAAVEATEHEHSLRTVCRLHSSVSSPAEQASADEHQPSHEHLREFQPNDGAPGAAREFLDEVLHRWGHGRTAIDDARLLLTELVTNAVIHARSPVVVSIRRHGSRVRLAVHDKSPAKPVARGEVPTAPWGGWGMRIVAGLSNEWGVEMTSGGKTVWADL